MTPKEIARVYTNAHYNDNVEGSLMFVPITDTNREVLATGKHIGGRMTLILRGFSVKRFAEIAEQEARSFGFTTKVKELTGRWGDCDFEEVHYQGPDSP